jgi:peptidylprolyl isomerase
MQLSRRALFATTLIGAVSLAVPALAADPDNTMIITLKDGDVTIALSPIFRPSI